MMAADDTLEVRVEERLKIKIGEAKNLPSRSHGAPTHRDPYCILSLDQEEIFRTSTIERTLNPFFGEEFQFEVPRRFRYLSIYVFDRDKHLKRDKVLGKVAIKREDLHLYNNKDHWFALRSVSEDSEVQGEAHIELSLESANMKRRRWSSRKRNLSSYCRLGRLGVSATEPSLSSNLSDTTNRCHPPNHPSSSERSNSVEGELGDYSSDPERSCETPDSISVTLLECSELSSKDGRCDPYATIALIYSDGSQVEKRTSTCRGTVEPQFDEKIAFPLRRGANEATEVRVSLWHDSTPPTFLGEVRLLPTTSKAWYFLASRTTDSMIKCRGATPPGTRLSSGQGASLGSLRLLLHYTADHVFPLSEYAQLANLLLKNNDCIRNSCVYVIGEVVSSKQDAAQPLVRFFAHHRTLEPLLRSLADAEIQQLTDATTIFRGNTLVSKMMDEAMRLFGSGYLRSVLKPVLEVVLAERRACELDVTRMKDASQRQTNFNNLTDYVQRVLSAITRSAVQCPLPLRKLLECVKLSAIQHFPENEQVRYSVVSAFILLRFFAPAILGPRLFSLTNQHIDAQTNRTLTLISKTIQTLGNLVSSRSAAQICKEEYMTDFYKSFSTTKHIESIKHFLEVISSSSELQNSISPETQVILKEGLMTKRSENSNLTANQSAVTNSIITAVGQSSSGWRKSPRKRYFRLTTNELLWAKSAKTPIEQCTKLALNNVTRVAPLHNSPNLHDNNMFLVEGREKTLFIQANNCVERAEWVRLLRSLCPSAREHSGHYIRYWSCCSATCVSAPGCEPVCVVPTPLEMNERSNDMDVARELQRIHSLLLQHVQQLDERLRTLLAANNTTQKSNGGVRSGEIASVRALREATFALEHRHRVYQRNIARATHYGSKQAPIGEDNYLQLAAKLDYSNQNSMGAAAAAGYLAMTSLKKGDMMKGVCEYVDMRHPDAYKCKEYELMCDFSSMAPAVPPRFKPKNAMKNPIEPPPRPPLPPQHLIQRNSSSDDSSDRMNSKPTSKESSDGESKSPTSIESIKEEKEELDLMEGVKCEAELHIEEEEGEEEEVSRMSLVRSAFQRKSSPSECSTSARRTQEICIRGANSACDVRTASRSSSNFLTKLLPFFRRKSKQSPLLHSESLCEKKEESMLCKLTPKFSLRSRKGGECSAKPEEVECDREERRVHLDSSIVANLQFLSLHRYGGATTDNAPATS